MNLSSRTIGYIQDLLQRVSLLEQKKIYAEYPEKTESKKISIGMFPPEVRSVLEIGGDEMSASIFAERGIERDNFGLHIDQNDDMHTMSYLSMYDGVYARHVLEHSPFPLLAMQNIFNAVRDGGWVVIVVPVPGTAFVDNWDTHMSVMLQGQWRRIFTLVGFKTMDTVERDWTPSPNGEMNKEYIFLLKK